MSALPSPLKSPTPNAVGVWIPVSQRLQVSRQCGIGAWPHRFRDHFSHTWLDRGGPEGDLIGRSPRRMVRANTKPTQVRARMASNTRVTRTYRHSLAHLGTTAKMPLQASDKPLCR